MTASLKRNTLLLEDCANVTAACRDLFDPKVSGSLLLVVFLNKLSLDLNSRMSTTHALDKSTRKIIAKMLN